MHKKANNGNDKPNYSNQLRLLKKTAGFLPDGILILNARHKIVFANKEAEIIFKLEEDELERCSIENLFFSHNNFFKNKLPENDYPEDEVFEMHARCADGSSTFTSIKFQKLKEDNCLLCSIRNLTKVQGFAQSELAAVISCSDDAIIIKNLDGKILSWNASAEKLFGYKASEAIGKFINIIVPPEKAEEEELILSHIKNKKSERLETYRMRKDGSFVDVSICISPLQDKEGRVIGAVKIARDDTERVKLMHNLQNQNKQLEEFAHIIAHDFRSPISNMQSLLYLYKIEENSAARELYISKLNDCVAGLNDTFEDLLDVLYVHHEEKKKNLVYFDEVLHKVIAACESEISEAGAEIISDFLAAQSLYCFRSFIESILQNLISNAIKYRHPNRSPVVHVKSEKQQNQILLSVSDNGLGIDLKRHGNKLFGFHKTFHNHPKAKGVGLYLVKMQVEDMGGRIIVESKVNEGTTFKILFL